MYILEAVVWEDMHWSRWNSKMTVVHVGEKWEVKNEVSTAEGTRRRREGKKNSSWQRGLDEEREADREERKSKTAATNSAFKQVSEEENKKETLRLLFLSRHWLQPQRAWCVAAVLSEVQDSTWEVCAFFSERHMRPTSALGEQRKVSPFASSSLLGSRPPIILDL